MLSERVPVCLKGLDMCTLWGCLHFRFTTTIMEYKVVHTKCQSRSLTCPPQAPEHILRKFTASRLGITATGLLLIGWIPYGFSVRNLTIKLLRNLRYFHLWPVHPVIECKQNTLIKWRRNLTISSKLVAIILRHVEVSFCNIRSGACGGHPPSQGTRLNDW